MSDNKKILITGSSGFIGSHVCQLFDKEEVPHTILKRSKFFSHHTKQKTAHSEDLYLEWPEDLESLDFKDFSAIIHLAYPQIKQSDTEESLHQKHILPVKRIIKRIKETNPGCHLIFISSQSSSAETSSKYGQIKYQTEQLILESDIPWTILVPGLVYGNGGKGLFGQIEKITSLFPVIPVPGGEDKILQTVQVWDIAKAMLILINNRDPHARKKYFLSNPPTTFATFVKKISVSKKMKTLLIPIPDSLILNALGLLERIMKNPPFTKTNYLGLVQNKEIDFIEGWRALGIEPMSLDEGLHEMVHNPFPLLEGVEEKALAKEATYLFSSLFHRHIPYEIIKRYISAHSFMFRDDSSSPGNQIVPYLIEKGLDIEAIELALPKKDNVLRNKLLLLCYLAELEPEFCTKFSNKHKNFILGCAHASYATLAMIIKKIKGHYLIWRHPECTMQ
jgi:nucleoside-diphosphate-sugar epimerase